MSKVNLPPENEEWFSGDTKRVTYTVSGVADLTGYTISWRLFKDGVAVASKGVGTGVTIDDETHFTITVAAGDTAGLSGRYRYECQGTSPSGEIITLAHGVVSVMGRGGTRHLAARI